MLNGQLLISLTHWPNMLQALAVQFPSWLPYLSDSAPHVTVSVAEGVPAREAGDLIRDARKGQRARIVPLVSMKLLHGGCDAARCSSREGLI